MSTTKSLFIGALAFALTLAVGSCVLPESGSAAGAASQPVLKINGRTVTADKFVQHPLLRQGIQQYCIIDTMWNEFGARGHTIDESIVDERLELARENALRNGVTFEQMLRDMHSTENDMIENFRVNQAIETLADDYIDLSDANLRIQWESNKEYYTNFHMRNASLTDQERDSLTFEDVRDTVIDQYKKDQSGASKDAMFQDLLDKSDLDLLCIADAKEREFFEDMIINSFKSDYVWPETGEGTPEESVEIQEIPDLDGHDADAAEGGATGGTDAPGTAAEPGSEGESTE